MKKKVNILIVEDEGATATDIKFTLLNKGYGISSTAATGLNALKEIQYSKPDLVLMDIRLPGEMDGIETAEKIWSDYGIPIIYLSAHIDNELIERSRKTKPYGYLLKPFKEDELHATITMALERHKLQKKLKETMGKLKKNEETLKLALEATTEGIWDWNIATGYIYYSPVWQKIAGVQDIKPDFQSWESLVHRDDRKVFKDSLDEHFKGIQQYWHKEMRLYCQTGTQGRTEQGLYKWILGRGKVTAYDSKGSPVRMVGTISDISERKKAEEELIRAKEKAEEADRLKTAFLSNMSHEIRTPINGILGFASLLKDNDLAIQNKTNFIDLISQSSRQLLSLIDDIIDLSRIETGALPIVESPFHLKDFIKMIYNSYRKQLEILPEHKTKLILEIDEKTNNTDDLICSDETRLEQVISNLLNNALKFTLRGTIRMGYKNDDKYICFWVKDTGPGMNDEEKSHIFSRFRQANETTSRVYGGAGLGLSICQGIVELLHGTIWVESEKDTGSSFFVTIPYKKGAPEPKKTILKPPSSNYSLKGVRTLVVEDNELNKKLLEAILTKSKASALFVSSGLEAVKKAKEEHFDLVLMDIRLPDISGIQAAHLIWELDTKTPIIAITAYALVEERRKILEAGFQGYLTKPFDTNELLEKMAFLTGK